MKEGLYYIKPGDAIQVKRVSNATPNRCSGRTQMGMPCRNRAKVVVLTVDGTEGQHFYITGHCLNHVPAKKYGRELFRWRTDRVAASLKKIRKDRRRG